MNKEKFNRELTYKSALKIVVIGVLLYCGIHKYKLILSFLMKAFGVVFPFVLGGVIAFIFNVPMRKIESLLFPKKKNVDSLRRGLAYVLTLVSIIGVISLALIVITPQVKTTVEMIVDRVPGAFETFQEKLYKLTKNMPDVQSYIEEQNIDWGSISSYAVTIIQKTSSAVFSSGFSIISGIIGGVTTFVVAFIFSIYVLLQKEKLSVQGKKVLFSLLKEEKAERILYVLRLANKIFSSFLSGQCIEAVILGSMFFITLSIVGIPYAVLVGVIIAITALIPIFGAFIGCAISAFLIVMVDPMKAFWFIIIFFALQQIENNLIYPNVVGGTIGLPSIWVLVAVMVGGDLFGVAGIIFFIPFTSVCYALFREYIYKRLKEKEIPEEKWQTVSEIEIPEDLQDTRRKKKKVKKRVAKEITKESTKTVENEENPEEK